MTVVRFPPGVGHRVGILPNAEGIFRLVRIIIEAPLEELEARVKESQELMREASRQVLGDFELTTDADIYRHPER